MHMIIGVYSLPPCRRRSSNSASTSGAASRAISVSSWQQQAGEAIRKNDTTDFRSLAIAFEVRAAEALDRCARHSSGPATDPGGAPLPDALRTAVCCQVSISSAHKAHTRDMRADVHSGDPACMPNQEIGVPFRASGRRATMPSGSWHRQGLQAPAGRVCKTQGAGAQLLGELGAACVPFARPLEQIRDELARAVFSSYHMSDDGTTNLRQLPYFAVAARLETEKQHLLADAEAARLALEAHKARPQASRGWILMRATLACLLTCFTCSAGTNRSFGGQGCGDGGPGAAGKGGACQGGRDGEEGAADLRSCANGGLCCSCYTALWTYPAILLSPQAWVKDAQL